MGIILEDDCLPSADFFRFTTELLDRYADKKSVGLISGSSRLRGRSVSDSSYDFSADVRIWGWATWARTWQSFSGSGDLEKTMIGVLEKQGFHGPYGILGHIEDADVKIVLEGNLEGLKSIL